MTQTVDGLKEDLEIAERRIQELLNELSSKEEELLEAASEATLEDYTTSDITSEFYCRSGINDTMVNGMKADLFFEHLEEIPLSKFEKFIKELNQKDGE